VVVRVEDPSGGSGLVFRRDFLGWRRRGRSAPDHRRRHQYGDVVGLVVVRRPVCPRAGFMPGRAAGCDRQGICPGLAKEFLPRLRAAEVFAQLAMRPIPVALLVPLFRSFPPLVTLMARWSGKARQVVPSGKGVPRSIDRRTDQPDA